MKVLSPFPGFPGPSRSSGRSGRARVRLGAAALVLLIATASAVAQEDPVGRLEERLEVLEVLLDVVVTGPKGNVILALEKEDFLVEEQGRSVELESISFYSNRRLQGASAGPDQTRAAPDDRYFVLLFFRPAAPTRLDLPLLAHLPKAGQDCLEWVAGSLLPNDFLAVASFDGGLNVVEDFTTDLARIELAIRQTAKGKAAKKHWPSRTGKSIPGISLAPLIADDTVRNRTRDPFIAITELARGLGDVAGRKILILLGPDFPSGYSLASRRGYEPMVQALNANNVAVYPIDITGRGRFPTPTRLARATGGRYPFHGRDVLAALEDIERENSGFYLLSYRSEHIRGLSGYREVEVRTLNPEFVVRSRGGYRFGG